LAYHESYGKTGRAREVYAALPSGERVSACRDCGACEKACPYGVAVRRRIREAAQICQA
jgi:NAD-dependent dihydropyrimidine dehydrogenase PreA subunit